LRLLLELLGQSRRSGRVGAINVSKMTLMVPLLPHSAICLAVHCSVGRAGCQRLYLVERSASHTRLEDLQRVLAEMTLCFVWFKSGWRSAQAESLLGATGHQVGGSSSGIACWYIVPIAENRLLSRCVVPRMCWGRAFQRQSAHENALKLTALREWYRALSRQSVGAVWEATYGSRSICLKRALGYWS